MALNLSRNTKLYVSTVKTGNTAANTWEIPVLSDYSFSQDAESQTITLNEAGDAPVRGQKIFNTALNPVEVSIPTYVRPYYNTNHYALERVLWEALVGAGPVGTHAKPGSSYMEVEFKGSDVHELLKLYLFFQVDNTTYRVNEVAINSAEIDFSIDSIAKITWNGQGSTTDEIDISGWTAGVDYTAAANVHIGGTDAKFIKNKLSSISIKKVTGTASAAVYANFGASLDPTIAVDFDGTNTYVATIIVDGGSAQTISIDSSGNYSYDPSKAVAGSTVQDAINEINYQLSNAVCYIDGGDLKITSSTSGALSSINVDDDTTNPLFGTLDTATFTGFKEADNTTSYTEGTTVNGTGSTKTYNVPITGGSLTIENNITYLTPEELGKVNKPIGSFTGTRAVSGSITAYLKTGSNNTAGLLADLASDTSTVTHEFEMTMHMGGANNTPRVSFIMNHAHLVIPSIQTEDVLSTEINFTALGEGLDISDELVVRYVSPTT